MFVSFRRFHLKRVVEPVEVVEKAYDGGEFNDLPFVVMRAKLCPEAFVHVVGIERHAFGEAQRNLLFGQEVRSSLKVCQILHLVVGITVALCQSAMRRQSILAPVDLADAYRDQFLELGGYRARIHHGAEMRNHGA